MTLRAIWYIPTVSAPRERDIQILNRKDNSRVSTENAVTMEKDLTVSFNFFASGKNMPKADEK